MIELLEHKSLCLHLLGNEYDNKQDEEGRTLRQEEKQERPWFDDTKSSRNPKLSMDNTSTLFPLFSAAAAAAAAAAASAANQKISTFNNKTILFDAIETFHCRLPFDILNQQQMQQHREHQQLLQHHQQQQQELERNGELKSSRKRTKRREKIAEGTLCVVCSDAASGIHYSVPSCNGCKTFFRRALVNKQSFQCQFRDECIVDKSVRCGCRSCRLKKCFQMGMDPKAIQHDRDKIRFTKKSKLAIERHVAIANSEFVKEESICSPTSYNTYDDPNALCSPSSSSLGQGPGSNSSSLPDYDSVEIQNEVSSVLSHLLELERKVNLVRSVNKFKVHTSVASCMYDQRLLEDEIWVALNTSRSAAPSHVDPISCDRDAMRQWFVKDLTLMIEWSKCLPQMEQLLLNDKLALIKAFAPIFPLIQLVHFSYVSRFQLNLVPTDNNIAESSAVPQSSHHSIVNVKTIPTPNGDSKIVRKDILWYPDGRYLESEHLRSNSSSANTQNQVFIYNLLMDGVYRLMERQKLSESDLVLYKLTLFFNPHADGLSSIGKLTITRERMKSLNYLFTQFSRDRGVKGAANSYADILLMTSTLTRVASFMKRTFDISHIFGPSNDLIDQLIIAGL